jgi:hypothetical protein
MEVGSRIAPNLPESLEAQSYLPESFCAAICPAAVVLS